MRNTALAATLLLASTNVMAEAGDHWIKAHFLSRHISGSEVWYDEDGKEQQWNEFNPGLGYVYEVTDYLEVTTGFYENSHNKLSLYGGAKWHTGYKNWVDFGVTVGLVSGYEVTQAVDTPVTGFVLPEFSFRISQKKRAHVRLDVGYIPGVSAVAEGEATGVITGTVRVKY